MPKRACARVFWHVPADLDGFGARFLHACTAPESDIARFDPGPSPSIGSPYAMASTELRIAPGAGRRAAAVELTLFLLWQTKVAPESFVTLTRQCGPGASVLCFSAAARSAAERAETLRLITRECDAIGRQGPVILVGVHYIAAHRAVPAREAVGPAAGAGEQARAPHRITMEQARAAAAAGAEASSGAGVAACFECEPEVSRRGLTGAGGLIETAVRLALALDESAVVSLPSAGSRGGRRCTVS